MSGLASGVTALAAGYDHTCALTTGGGVKCWGGNLGGQLGDGTSTNRSTPVDVSDLTRGVAALNAGGWHTCALMDDVHGRGVKCWGTNGAGQLGDGTTIRRLTPVDVNGLARGVAALAAGAAHTCVLTNQRTKCLGSDDYGQLGIGTAIPLQHSTPIDVVASAARLRLNYTIGQPGSYFTLTGENFPPGAQATLSVNGHVLTASLPIDELGQFIVFLSTADANSGYYLAQVMAGVNAMARFALNEPLPLRLQEGGGTTLVVPAAIGLPLWTRYLPLAPH